MRSGSLNILVVWFCFVFELRCVLASHLSYSVQCVEGVSLQFDHFSLCREKPQFPSHKQHIPHLASYSSEHLERLKEKLTKYVELSEVYSIHRYHWVKNTKNMLPAHMSLTILFFQYENMILIFLNQVCFFETKALKIREQAISVYKTMFFGISHLASNSLPGIQRGFFFADSFVRGSL